MAFVAVDARATSIVRKVSIVTIVTKADESDHVSLCYGGLIWDREVQTR